MPRLNFFRETSSDTYLPSKRTLVDVGGIGDCGFRAIAAGIIDNIAANSASQANKNLLETLFQAYDRYFPQREHLSLKDPRERFKRFISNPIMLKQFIRNLAYTLRQLAVLEMGQNPADYRGVFHTDKTEGTSLEKMSKETTWIDESAIAALANHLNLNITVSVVAKEKELPLKLHYKPQLSNASFHDMVIEDDIVIQLKNDHYQPKVMRPQLFYAANKEFVVDHACEPAYKDTYPSMKEIKAQIAESDRKIVRDFENHYQRLLTMVATGEINKTDLLEIYINNMGHSDYLQGFSRHVELNQANFEQIIDAARRDNKDIGDASTMLDDYMVERLVHAIARAMTIEHFDADRVYQSIEDKNSNKSIQFLR